MNSLLANSKLMFRSLIVWLLVIICNLVVGAWNFSIFAQQSNDIEFTLDLDSPTIPLPKIFSPGLDFSGRGFHHNQSWPQAIAAPEAIDIWQKDIGFGTGIYRLQYNLWEMHQLAKDKPAQESLLSNYEGIIKRVNDAGGIVILDIFGTPAGLGRVLDPKSPPWDLRAFKELVKGLIRQLSCDKKYNIWYEVWDAPDLDDFFLGKKQEYLNLYRAVAESIKELEAETKIHIPIGGPSTSRWFQDLDGNTVISAEKSLIYELIKFCYRLRLPLNFVSWHSYSGDPKAEQESTVYKKNAVTLIRNWLAYFNFERDTPFIIDEWNYDRPANVLTERKEKSHIAASFVASRIKHMYEAGINYQCYFSLEDFQDNKEGLVRNLGVFWFDGQGAGYKGGAKAVYNVFRMLKKLGKDLFVPLPKINDEFVGAVATQDKDATSILIYNYIDPEAGLNYLSRNIATLNGADRKILLGLIKSGQLPKIISRQADASGLRASSKLKSLLKKAQELNDLAARFSLAPRNLKVNIDGLEGNYLYERYSIDSSCSLDCEFRPSEEKEITAAGLYQEAIILKPYSAHLVIFRKKPAEEPVTEDAQR